MFFIAFFGIQDKEKHIGSCSNIVCASCGRLSRYEISKSYRCFHIFFIPLFRWNVRYLAKSVCCGSLFELVPDIGRQFEKNSATEIRNEHLRRIDSRSSLKYCYSCRTAVPADFIYCPYCGGKL